MYDIYFDGAGNRVPNTSKKIKYIVRKNSEYSWSLLERRKTGDASLVCSEPLRVQAMFKRVSGVEFVDVQDIYFNVFGHPIDTKGAAIWYQSEKGLLLRGKGESWQRYPEQVPIKYGYYDSNGLCDEKQADCIKAVLPNGVRVKCKLTGEFSSYLSNPFKGKRYYIDSDGTERSSTDAKYKLVQPEDKNEIEVYIKSINKWIMMGTIAGFHLISEIKAIGRVSAPVYRKVDNTPTPAAEDAVSVEVEVVPGKVSELRIDEKVVARGTPVQIKEASAPTVVPDNKQSYNPVEAVWQFVEGTTWLTKDAMTGYLAMLMHRNYVRKGGPVINTRLWDIFNQPIYVVDTDYEHGVATLICKVDKLRVVSSLEQAKKYCPYLKFMPPPLQWSDNPADVLWNSTIELQPITVGNLQHIYNERNDRLPKSVASLPAAVAMQAIKAGLEESARVASSDIQYALPTYSKEHKEVSLLLPIKIPVLFGDKVIAAAVLARNANNYKLATIITTEMARRGVGLFTNPNNTWLKEENCYAGD